MAYGIEIDLVCLMYFMCGLMTFCYTLKGFT